MLYLPVADADAQLIEIGATKDESLAEATRTVFSTVLKKSLSTGWTLGEAVGQLLMFPGNGMKALQPYRGVYDVWLNHEQFFLQPQLSGGAEYTDNFNRADGDLGANWTAVPSFIEPTIVSNAVQPVGVSTTWSVVRYSAQTFSDDQYASVKLVTANGSSNFVAPAVRGSDTTQTVYYTRTNGPLGSTADGNITKWVSGTATTLFSFTDRTVNANTIVKLDVRGSTLRRYEDGVLKDTVTDTSITSGWPGLYVAADGGVAGDSVLDDWVGGDSEAFGVRPMNLSSFPKPKLRQPMSTGRSF